MQSVMIERAKALLADGTVARVIGWKAGEFDYDQTPATFSTAEELDAGFVFDDFSAANLSKYLIKETLKEGKTLVFLKPCDSYSLNQLVSEHRIKRERVYAIGVACDGKLDAAKAIESGAEAATSMKSDGKNVTAQTLYGTKTLLFADALAERCVSCKSRAHVACDEIIGAEGEKRDAGRFDLVAKLEAMSEAERFDFWRGELSRCVRCNACRNVCPACTCEKCVFDNDASGVAQKAAVVPFEENMFHIIRAFHVAGRCTDCGECSRVCPQNIPLHLLNRKFIKDIDELYGDYQAGEDAEAKGPLGSFKTDDVEPSVVHAREGGKK